MFFLIFGFLMEFIFLSLIHLFFFKYLKNFSIKFFSIYFFYKILEATFVFLNFFLKNYNLILIIKFGTWLRFENIKINWEFTLDSFNIFLIIIIIIISILIQIYSWEYLYYDINLCKFLSYLSLFSFFMIFLILSNNFFMLFIGWEGVGLISFLLINFWSTRYQANKAALKAMIFNRIGDFTLLFGIFIIFESFNTLNFHSIFSLSFLYNEISCLNNKFLLFNIYYFNIFDFICFFLFIGCMAKSAQLGLHLWLPDAMEGPTPVSALLHAATMVTAGVFLLIRCSFFLEFSDYLLNIISIIGVLTAFIAASIGLFQNDIKKIIAYSTCSQLGYMILICGLSGYSLSLFHLCNHAFFKALLFLSAGSLIHSLSEEQDIRNMGGFLKIFPISYISILIGSCSLMGFPFFSGFFSKELILFSSFIGININFFIFFLAFITSIITSMYSIKLIYFVFFKNTQVIKELFKINMDMSFFFLVIFSGLIILSISSGFFLKEFFALGSIYFSNSIFILPLNFFNDLFEFIPLWSKLLILFCPFFGIYLFYFFYNFYTETFFIKFIYFFNKKWYLDKLNYYFLFIIYFFFKFLFYTIDKGLIEKSIISYLNSFYLIFFFLKNCKTNKWFNFTFSFLFILILIIFIYYFFLTFVIDSLILLLIYFLIYFFFLNRRRCI